MGSEMCIRDRPRGATVEQMFDNLKGSIRKLRETLDNLIVVCYIKNVRTLTLGVTE